MMYDTMHILLMFNHDISFIQQSVDPGQQFTWEHSNLEVNKPKNRYANVIAYDHSRVLLSAIDGKATHHHFHLSTDIYIIDSFTTWKQHTVVKNYMGDLIFPSLKELNIG